jgi:membrane protease YdiL (CAAX protease family)
MSRVARIGRVARRETHVTTNELRPWVRPAAYISLASVSCFLFTAFTPPLLDPALAARIPLVGRLPGDLPGYWTRFALSFLLLGAAPLALALAFGDKPADLGLRFDVPLLRSPLYWLGIPAAVAIGALGAISPDLASFYPYSRDLLRRVAAEGIAPFAAHFAAYFFLYYVPWEFFFRGFLLLSLLASVERGIKSAKGSELGTTSTGTMKGGAVSENGAVLVATLVFFQTMPSTMLHVGHPLSELAGAVVAGLGFGLLAWKTRSIVPGLFLHAAIGLGTDGFIVLKNLGAL